LLKTDGWPGGCAKEAGGFFEVTLNSVSIHGCFRRATAAASLSDQIRTVTSLDRGQGVVMWRAASAEGPGLSSLFVRIVVGLQSFVLCGNRSEIICQCFRI